MVLDTDQGKKAVKKRDQEVDREDEDILDDQIFQQREEDQPQVIEAAAGREQRPVAARSLA